MAMDEAALSQDTKELWSTWSTFKSQSKDSGNKQMSGLFYPHFQSIYAIMYADFLQSIAFTWSNCYFIIYTIAFLFLNVHIACC